VNSVAGRAAGPDRDRTRDGLHGDDPSTNAASQLVEALHHLLGPVPLGLGREALGDEANQQAAQGQDQQNQPGPRAQGPEALQLDPGRLLQRVLAQEDAHVLEAVGGATAEQPDERRHAHPLAHEADILESEERDQSAESFASTRHVRSILSLRLPKPAVGSSSAWKARILLRTRSTSCRSNARACVASWGWAGR